jgi:hypothetical protein
MRLRTLSAAVWILLASLFAHADTLAQYTVVAGVPLNGQFFVGQSFTVVGSGSYTDITFDYYTPTAAPYALGTGFLFSSAYLGAPADLSPALPGYLGSGAAVGNVYNFGSSVTLTAGDQYFFYESARLPLNSITFGTVYSGGMSYSVYFDPTSTFGSSPYDYEGYSADFLVTGSPVSLTPEPSSLMLLGTGVLGFAGVLRRRFR